MNYKHDGAEWSTNLKRGETIKIAGRTDHYEGCVGRIIGVLPGIKALKLEGVIAVQLEDRARSFCPHDLCRPNGEPHISLIAGKPKVVNRPLTRKEPTKFREFSLRGAAKRSAERAVKR